MLVSVDVRSIGGVEESGIPVGDYVRQVRARTGLSQRDLARVAKVGRATVERLEAGSLSPRLDVLVRILALAGFGLVVVRDGAQGDLELVPPLEEFDGDGNCRDGAGRRYPAHLPLIVDPVKGEWWGDRYGLARPPETFHRNQTVRELRRAISRSEVRHDGPPPNAPVRLMRLAHWAQLAGSSRPRVRRPVVEPPEAARRATEADRAPIHAPGVGLARLGP